MPAFADSPIRRLASSGSTNALFRLGEEFLVRMPRQPRGSAAISKEATWLPLLGPLLPVSVPEVVDPGTSVDPGREDLAISLATVLRTLGQAEVPREAVNNRT